MDNGGIPVDGDLARRLYRDMVLGRRLDQEAYSLQRQGELALWLMSLGQEAAQAGSINAIRGTDYVFPSYRDHVAGLARGISTQELLRQWRGATHGAWDPESHNFHIYSLVLATQLLHAVGYAMGVRLDGSDTVVLTYFGDGATSQGDASEAFNLAAVTRSPVVFFCQNNGWAISTPTEAQFSGPLVDRAAGFGLDAVSVDGNDAIAVFVETQRAVERVRSGGAPAFIEAHTFRMAGHSTSDDPLKYRSVGIVDHWASQDPVDRMRKLLHREEWADEAYFIALAGEAEALAAETRDACFNIAEPDLGDVFRATLTTETPLLQLERQRFEQFKGSFL
ncbi:MAG: pyruvate dehydrogenase (acetyl-transferring) E1 component subunit alpha [Gemmatimonadales bacterium]|nr:pyruvate dehydrogenase (acetyl-transferring) E1 component subunit alpha [Gemmatimonadales bacterium]